MSLNRKRRILNITYSNCRTACKGQGIRDLLRSHSNKSYASVKTINPVYSKRKTRISDRMYPLLTSENLSEMRDLNERSLNWSKEDTSQGKKDLDNKKCCTPGDFRKELYRNIFKGRTVVDYPQGPVQMFSLMPFYYRGQRKDYNGICYSSLFRNINDFNKDEKERKIFLNQLRINELKHLLNNFTQVQEWDSSYVNIPAIAQHYGFDTDLIDITDDLDVALFFACCKHNEENSRKNEYLPLSKQDLEANKYGLLFRKIAVSNAIDILTCDLNYVVPIGYQPFNRSNSQRGHYFCTNGEDFQAKGGFEIFKFEHSIKLSQELYTKFDGGKKLFKDHALDRLSSLFNDIKYAVTFSRESFKDTYKQLHGELSEEDWMRILDEKETVEIGKASYKLCRQMKRTVNRSWSKEKYN